MTLSHDSCFSAPRHKSPVQLNVPLVSWVSFGGDVEHSG